MRSNVLIIDDEPDFNHKLRIGIPDFDYDEALTVEASRNRLRDNTYDLILLDLNLNPDTEKLDGLDLIQPIKKNNPATPLVVVTADEKTETVVTAMKLGADDFLRKSSFDLLAWKKKFDLLIENRSLSQRIHSLEEEKYQFVGNSSGIKEIRKTLDTLADNPDVTVLITGETGSGKEVSARYLHQRSKRRSKPFVPVNLAAFQDTLIESALFGHKKGAFTGATSDRMGYFRKADGGIIFLDEIGDLTLSSQGKLLRFLEDKIINVVGDEKDIQLDVQVLAATNKDLKKLVAEAGFREDLYYRIKNFTVEIPLLRERKEDIIFLVHHFLSIQGFRTGMHMVSDRVWKIFKEYDWPGNVRELKNTIDFALIKSGKGRIEAHHLPKDLTDSSLLFSPNQETNLEFPLDLEEKAIHFQLELIDRALGQTHGNKSKAVSILNLDLDKMRYKIITNRSFITEGTYPNIRKYYKKIF
jgi:DNA-binding NtrC family response regulator